MKTDNEQTKNQLHMRIYLFCIGLCLLLAICSAALVQAGHSGDDMERLWQKAVFYMEHNQWVPGEVVEHEQTFSLLGKMVEETHAVFSLKPAPQQKVELFVESAEENGKDVTAEARREINGVLTLAEVLEESPFSSTDDQSLTADFNGRLRQIHGVQCAGFDFIFIDKDTRIEGVAWVAQDSGLPVEITSRITSVPFTEEGIKIKSYEETEYYTLTGDGHSKLTKSHVELDIELPLMRFKGKVTTVTTCRDHWLLAIN